MSDERNKADAPRHATEPEDDDVERLLDRAGPREDVPAEHLQSIKSAFRAEWAEHVARTHARRRTARRRALAAAAALLFAAVLTGWWLTGRSEPVARVETVAGAASLRAPDGGRAGAESSLSVGRAIASGATIETAPAGGVTKGAVALRLAGGTSLRLDAGTSIRLVSAKVVELGRGGLYVDSGPQGRIALEVHTPLGTATDVGTQFEVRLLPDPESLEALRVRVREGRVVVAAAPEPADNRSPGTEEGAAGEHEIAAGTELTLHGDGSVERRAIATWGEAWHWVLDVAPPFAVTRPSLADYLAWVGRETGWTIRFEDAALADSATTVELLGSLAAIPADGARDVLPSAGLASELDDGVLLIYRPGAAETP